MRSTIPLAMALLLGGCAMAGARYSDDPAVRAPIAGQLARLTILRPDESILTSERLARLKLDGSYLGGIRSSRFRIAEVPPGVHTLQVDLYGTPGECEASFQASPGTNTFFEITPRQVSSAIHLVGAVIAAPPGLGNLLAGTATEAVAQASESAGKRCGGAFSIIQVDSSAALPKLSELRHSN